MAVNRSSIPSLLSPGLASVGEDQDEPRRPKRKAGGTAMGEAQASRLDHRARGGKLSAADRRALPSKDFALPGGRYPINDPNHGRNALARVSQFGTESEKARVTAVVHKKFPEIGKG